MVMRTRLPAPLPGIMEDFALGNWGENLHHFAEDASLIAFLDDALQAVLETELSPIVLNGHLGLASYTARVGAVLGPMDYDVISVTHNGFQVATEVAWNAVVRRTIRRIAGRTCSVWTLSADHKVQSLVTVSWLVEG